MLSSKNNYKNTRSIISTKYTQIPFFTSHKKEIIVGIQVKQWFSYAFVLYLTLLLCAYKDIRYSQLLKADYKKKQLKRSDIGTLNTWELNVQEKLTGLSSSYE